MSDTPDWFWDAVDTKSEKGFVEVDDSDINFLKWSDPAIISANTSSFSSREAPSEMAVPDRRRF